MKRMILICLVWAMAMGTAPAADKLVLPEILEPTAPEAGSTRTLERRTNRFDVRGSITGFGTNSIQVNDRNYPVTSQTAYLGGDGRTLYQFSFRAGDPVGLVLDSAGNVIEVREIAAE